MTGKLTAIALLVVFVAFGKGMPGRRVGGGTRLLGTEILVN